MSLSVCDWCLQHKMPKKWLCTTLTYHYCFFLLFVIADVEPVYRSHTVIIFHLPETEIFPKDLYADVVAFFHTFLGMTNVSESDIVYATRFGFENRTSQHRPVKVRFFSSEIPNAAYASRKKLIGTDFVIARPRSGKEVEDIRILSRYEKKLQAQYNNIKTALAGTTLFIEDLSHSVNDILRLERIENATEKLLAKGETPMMEYEAKPTSNNTLVISGIIDTLETDFEKTVEELVEFFESYLALKVDPMSILKANRIGYARDGCRSIVVRFINSKVVSQIFKRRTYLASTDFYLNRYLSREDLTKSKILKRYLNKLRRQGKLNVKFSGTALYFDGRAHTADEILELEKNETLRLLRSTRLTTQLN